MAFPCICSTQKPFKQSKIVLSDLAGSFGRGPRRVAVRCGTPPKAFRPLLPSRFACISLAFSLRLHVICMSCRCAARWVLKGTPPEMRNELLALITSSLQRESPEPMVFASLWWSVGRLKIDHVAPLLAPLRDALREPLLSGMNVQNLTTVWCSCAKVQSFAEEVGGA